MAFRDTLTDNMSSQMLPQTLEEGRNPPDGEGREKGKEPMSLYVVGEVDTESRY